MASHDELMSILYLADPETASRVQDKLSGRLPHVTENELGMIVDETIWGLSQETAFGQAVATGLIELSGVAVPDHLELFRIKVREAGGKSAAVGRIVAVHLVPVLKTGDNRLIERFNETTLTLLKIGAYTLGGPFETLSYLLETGDIESGLAFLDLITGALSPDMSYNQCKHLCHIIPRAVQSFTPSRRLFQIGQLLQVARTDGGLVDAFLEGMQRGASLLDARSLPRFVSAGLIRFNADSTAGARFLSLESQQARDLVDELQVAVSFSQVQHGLNRYLQARTGRTLSVCPLSDLSGTDVFTAEKPLVCSCANRIVLPDEISRFSNRPENLFLYKCLTRLEACYHEFGTYEFDLEKALESCVDSEFPEDMIPGPGGRKRLFRTDAGSEASTASDMIRFCRIFSNPALAGDLLTVFEHGRIRIVLEHCYPGIVRQSLPVLAREATRIYPENLQKLPLEALYLRIAFGMAEPVIEEPLTAETEPSTIRTICAVARSFSRIIDHTSRVEDCAALVWKSYARIEFILNAGGIDPDYRLKTPFDRGLRPDLAMDSTAEIKADLIKRSLAEKGIHVYKSEIRKFLAANGGKIGKKDIVKLIRAPQLTAPSRTAVTYDAASADLAELLDLSDIPGVLDTTVVYDTLPATWYREWDHLHGEYLHNHVRVVDRIMEGAGAGFYEQTLERYRELVSQIRYAFEMMKPQGLKLLRNWTEGDELDYRAILDFVLDQKAGLIPSDRLYIKRIKQERNVAMLLLVDLSRSTGKAIANTPSDGGTTVLDVEKEAMVLVSEALGIVGDTFAIGGFSGNGRLSVDYTHIKEFDEPLNDAVRSRISGLNPQRSTRMGAAIRHAAAQFDKIQATVRLLVILGDGFPNDVDYKQGYAISDTRQAIGEAISRRIHTHAITVNMQSDARLDDLYGSVHHTVISDVRELPAKLLRIYSALTRSQAVM